MYINHINKYDDAQAIQDALDAGTLANPYVAMTSAGTIDYNSLEPTPPAPVIYVLDSEGNYYYPQEVTEGNEVYYQFEFTIDAADSWTLYKDGEPVETESGAFYIYNECNGISNTVDQLTFPHTFENETYTGGFDNPSLAVFLYWYPSQSHIFGGVTAQYCDGSDSSGSAES